MNKNIIIGAVIGGVLLLGGVGYFVLGNSSNDDGNSQTTGSESSFSAQAYNYPVTITVTTTDTVDSDKNGTSTIQMESEDTWKMTAQTTEGATQTVVTSSAVYIQSPGTDTWIKIPGDTGAELPLQGIATTPTDFEEFRSRATYLGKESCGQDTCDTWQWIDSNATGDVSTIKILNDRIAEVVVVSDTTTTVMLYDFSTPVSIEIPTNATEFSVPQ